MDNLLFLNNREKKNFFSFLKKKLKNDEERRFDRMEEYWNSNNERDKV